MKKILMALLLVFFSGCATSYSLQKDFEGRREEQRQLVKQEKENADHGN